MKRLLLRFWPLCTAVCLFAGCDPAEESADWTLSYSALSALKPMTVKEETFARVTEGKYYREWVYACSDSLGSLCIWNRSNELDNDVVTGEQFYNRPNVNPAFTFAGNEIVRYQNLAATSPSEGFSPCMWYWYFNAANGTLAYQPYPIERRKDIQGQLTLMMISEDYIVFRLSYQFVMNSYYALVVFESISEATARNYWDVDHPM